ncbi:MAG: hypothetical protein J6W36_08265 [Clostridiales bacterium]|nr:hypothetical protein [Clostridiales bacterium]
MKKISVMLLALLIAGNTLLCSCGQAPAATSEETTAATTTEATTTTAEETTEETTTVSPFVTYANPKENSPYKAIELDGVKKNAVITTEYCYIESDKYIVFLDKDLKIPGDLKVNLDAIVDEIERQLGVTYNPPDARYDTVSDIAARYYEPKDEDGNGPNPWEGWDIGDKIPIFIVADRHDKALLSAATDSDVVICMYELFTNELWNSVPSYKKNAWRRSKYVDYSSFAHEITHTITLRNCEMTKILTEGIADYMAYSVISSLASMYPSLAEVKKKKNWDDDSVRKKINAKNAESVFTDDYHKLGIKNRGAEYAYGKRFWQFLYTTYGKGAFKKFYNGLKESNITYNYAEYDKATTKEYAALFKKLYGKDVFTKFGKWCVKKKVLQR